jgi:hypothetical protein
VYFLRNNSGPIDIAGKAVKDEMRKWVKFGAVNSKFLLDIQLLLSEIYLPLFSAGAALVETNMQGTAIAPTQGRLNWD